MPLKSIIPPAEEPPSSPEAEDFEEVTIDGSCSEQPHQPAISIARSPASPTQKRTVFMCKPCKVYFPERFMLDKHLRTVHEPEQQQQQQPSVSSKPPSILQQLREHVVGYSRLKTGEYKCNHCPRVDRSKIMLLRHVARRHPSTIIEPVELHTQSVTVKLERTSSVDLVPAEPKKEEIQLVEDEEVLVASVKPSVEEEENEPATWTEDEPTWTEDEPTWTEEGRGLAEAGSDLAELREEEDEVLMVEPEIESDDFNWSEPEPTPEQNETAVEASAPVKKESRLYYCHQCDFSAKSRLTVRTHTDRTHNFRMERLPPIKVNINCAYCDYKCRTRGTLNAHTRFKHPGQIQPYQVPKVPRNVIIQCDQCDYNTKDRHKMQMHIERKHVTELRYGCEYCGKKFRVKVDLTSHIRFQHFTNPIVCDVCGKVCSNSNSLHVHQKREHFLPKFECHVCHRRMVNQENLEEHVRRQHEEKTTYMCEQCGKVFDLQSKLKQHIMTHTGERPHECHLCGKAFARRAVFRQHLLIHTGQRPYVCDICGKAFTQKPGLICHRKMHPGEKPPLPVVFIDHILNKYVQHKEPAMEVEVRAEEMGMVYEETEGEEIVE